MIACKAVHHGNLEKRVLWIDMFGTAEKELGTDLINRILLLIEMGILAFLNPPDYYVRAAINNPFSKKSFANQVV